MESSPSITGVYERAGFGRTVQRGPHPAVVVVDFSNGFTDPAQPTGAEMTDAVSATAQLLEQARAAGLPVVFTTIAYDPGQVETLPWLRKAPGMAALTRGSKLVELDSRLDARAGEHLVVKSGPSAFFGTGLAPYLTSVRADTVIVTGATTSGCVRATVVDAVQCGYPVLVPSDCVADRASGPHEANLFDIDQKYGDVVALDDALNYLRAPAQQICSAPHPDSSSTNHPETEVRA